MPLFQGVHTALATPFRAGAFDREAYAAHIEDQIARGVSGLVPIGTTGEAATLDSDERVLAVRTAVEVSGGRVPVIAGAGSNSTRTTIEEIGRLRDAGANAALVVTPYYNKPTQAGLVAHYRALADAHPCFPLVAYNVPGRTGVDLLPDTLLNLCDIPEIVGIKEATGSLTRLVDILEGLARKGLIDADRLSLLSGDDFTVAPFIALGGHGVISVSSNVVPELMVELVNAAASGDNKAAVALQFRLNPLHRALFLESNPIPVKAALAALGRFEDEIREPLTPMSADKRAILLDAMRVILLDVQ
ncbi:MAG: 4-hydroxy-tetrahydrodipicolinate synthase [Myxococcales bacterium]|jgi:4-hydroxy-tetrahydrodipicolinate synthase|nr:4-hydroxy-tetrahydrodipicolinate synthase [Myxococcales bacterium]